MMKRVLVFLLAALLLCGVATAMADTTSRNDKENRFAAHRRGDGHPK